MKSIVWLSLALASLPVFSQTPDPLPTTAPTLLPRVLTASGRTNFEIPMFGSTGRIGCDASGTVFFNVGTKPGEAGPFLSVSSDGRKHAVFLLPSEIRSFGDMAWAVSPGGTFYVLHGDFKEYKLVRFKGDGSVAGIFSLAIPPGVYVEHLAVADNEMMYVRGYRDTSEPLDKPRDSFIALLDASGKLVRDLSSGAPQSDLTAHHDLDGDAIAGEDGRFYVLGPSNVLVLNQSGEVERDLKFKKTDPHAYARRIDYSKGMISILLHSIHHSKPRQAADVEVRAILLNAQTGEQQGDFVFDPSTTGTVLCFNAQDGYSLMAVDGKMAAKDIAPIR